MGTIKKCKDEAKREYLKRMIKFRDTIRGEHCPKCGATLVLSSKIPNTVYKFNRRCLPCKKEYYV